MLEIEEISIRERWRERSWVDIWLGRSGEDGGEGLELRGCCWALVRVAQGRVRGRNVWIFILALF